MNNYTITLRWTDPNLIERGHRIYRSYSPIEVNNLPTPIATLSKNVTEYIDEGVEPDVDVYYRVSAFIDDHEMISDEYRVEPRSDVILITSSWSGFIKVFNDDFTTIDWTTRALTGRIFALDRDKQGNILVGYTNTVQALVKLSPNGDTLWQYTNFEGSIQAVTVGDDQLIYFITSSSILYVLDNAGNKVRQMSLPNSVASNTRTGMHVKNNKLWYLSNTLINHVDLLTDSVIWTHPYSYTTFETGLHVDEYENCYTERNGIIKVDSDGNQVWVSQSGGYTSFTTDEELNVYASSRSSGITKLTSSGALVWKISNGMGFNVAVDPSGNVYFDERNSKTINRVDANGQNRTVITTNLEEVSYAIIIK